VWGRNLSGQEWFISVINNYTGEPTSSPSTRKPRGGGKGWPARSGFSGFPWVFVKGSPA
jgi:hypothetical protein